MLLIFRIIPEFCEESKWVFVLDLKIELLLFCLRFQSALCSLQKSGKSKEEVKISRLFLCFETSQLWKSNWQEWCYQQIRKLYFWLLKRTKKYLLLIVADSKNDIHFRAKGAKVPFENWHKKQTKKSWIVQSEENPKPWQFIKEALPGI